MLKTLSRIAIATVVLSTATFAQSRTETVQHTPPNGMTCTVKGQVITSLFTTLQMEARIGGFSFGTSNIFLVPNLSYVTVGYESYGVTHKATPQFAWGAWAWQLGTFTYRAG